MPLRGLHQFELNLREVERKFTGEVLQKALLAAVQPVVKQAAATAPSRSGALGRSMTAEIMKSEPREAVVRVGPGRPTGSHGILLELGTIYMTARPFLATAYEATSQQVVDELEEIIGNEALNALEVDAVL